MNLQENLVIQQMAAPMRACADECLTCHSVCMSTLSYCLSKGGTHLDPHHLKLLEDCAEICQTSANFLLRGSDRHATTCGACADICERCAQSCEAMKDPVMQACADTCRKCAESCREMTAAH